MGSFWSATRDRLRLTTTTGGLIFVVSLLIFWLSPVTQVTDSNYSMLLSQDLLEHRSFLLDHYDIPRLPPEYHDNTYQNGHIHEIELVGDHLYYYFPPGTSILSAPFVAILNRFGLSASNPDGTYNLEGEIRIQALLAGLLMAIFTTLVFYTACLELPLVVSVVVAIGTALGTQVWSTASRGMWNETWGILLLAIVLYLLFRLEAIGRRFNPIVVATLLAWSYFVRPTNAVPIVAITVYLFFYHRDLLIRYLLTGAIWLALFMVYSWYHFHQLLPNYFLVNRLGFRDFWVALPGNVVSPSRGLLIFVPILFFLGYLLVRYWSQITHKRLVWLSLIIIVVHLVAVSGFKPWNGGACYGPRYSTSLIPWFALLGIIGIRARLKSPPEKRSMLASRAELAAGSLLLVLSIFMNARGAVSQKTWAWNVWPTSVDKVAGKIWDWRQPQFLAGLVRPPLPDNFPLLEDRIDFANPDSDKYMWYGWSWSEPEIRWSDGKEATVIFALNEIQDSILQIKMGPFLAREKVDEQAVGVNLNGRPLQTLVLRDDESRVYEVAVSKEVLKRKNILMLDLPNAVSPKSLKVSGDLRQLAVRVAWIQLQKRAPQR